MNERLEQLAKEAGMVMYPTGLGISENTLWGDRNIGKFAELIVQECAAQATTKLLKNLKHNETHQMSYNEGLRDGVTEFRKHFGVV